MKSERELFIEKYLEIYGHHSYSQLDFEIWQAAKASAIPEGYCVVPKEPTGDMIVFGSREHHGYDEIDSKAIYKAMIEAGELK